MNKFISFEGIDGCGKTTQINLISKYLMDKEINNAIVREPGNTRISESIREILLDNNNNISKITETLLFLSARSHLVNEVIKPEMNEKIILCDRYLDSTTAYQGYGNEFNIDAIDEMNKFATDKLFPDLTIIFDIDPRTSFKRINKRSLDRMESKGLGYFEKVRNGYLQIADLNQDRCKVIDCNRKEIMSIFNEVKELFKIYIIKEN